MYILAHKHFVVDIITENASNVCIFQWHEHTKRQPINNFKCLFKDK